MAATSQLVVEPFQITVDDECVVRQRIDIIGREFRLIQFKLAGRACLIITNDGLLPFLYLNIFLNDAVDVKYTVGNLLIEITDLLCRACQAPAS